MRSALIRSAFILVAGAAAGCAGPSILWEETGPRTPTEQSDIADCRSQARRQVAMRYPAQTYEIPSRGIPVQRPMPIDPGKSDAEGRYFEQCLRQKATMPVPPTE